MKTVAIIPARGGSKRLPRKNIYNIWGQPMIYWSIKAAKESRYIDDVYVTSEDSEILKISKKFKAKTIKRPLELANDITFKQFAITHALRQLKSSYDIVVSLQANSPEVNSNDIDAAITKFIKYDRNELFTVDNNLIQHGAFRIWKYEYVFQEALSTKSGVYIANYIDVHTIEDIKKLERIKKLDKK
jgi:CMP-N-acetylneuraminic acid synthetase|tara:strand:- start:94 stop:654 length:561 start_codon:yes stop_codon:yes gene_type:complete